MPENFFSIAIAWLDEDLLEIELAVLYHAWSGRERAYVTREALEEFARDLVAVAEGARSAVFDAGQPDLGYASCRLFEYDLARHVGMEVRIGHAGGHVSNRPDPAREVRVAVPVERQQLSEFAAQIQNLVVTEKGTATLRVFPDWIFA
jgi:hypothetical protein